MKSYIGLYLFYLSAKFMLCFSARAPLGASVPQTLQLCPLSNSASWRRYWNTNRLTPAELDLPTQEG